MEKLNEYRCSFCNIKACTVEDSKKMPAFCPMPGEKTLLEETENYYTQNKSVHKIALESSRTEAEGYCRWTRVEEVMNFAKRLGVETIGIAHCEGLMNEARLAHQIFKSNGFNVHSVCCKVGNLDKEKLGLKDEEKVRPGQYESACNPIAQARILEKAGCGLNVVIGLCVGHDSLFFQHAKAPTTVLVAKDRVTGHNPAAALYTSHSYYRRLKEE